MGAGAVAADPASDLRAVIAARARRASPGDALLHPVAAVALGLLLVNDHLLKGAWPGPVTGKLSDLAGMALFPLVLVSGWELFLALAGRWRHPSRYVLAAAICGTAVAFALVKTVPEASVAAAWLFGLAQWSIALPLRLLQDTPLPPVHTTVLIADPTDLIALPCLAVAAWIGHSRLVRGASRTR